MRLNTVYEIEITSLRIYLLAFAISLPVSIRPAPVDFMSAEHEVKLLETAIDSSDLESE